MLDWTMANAVPGLGARRPLYEIADPLLLKALAFWRSLSNDVPSRQAIDPIALGKALLPHVFLADVIPKEPRYIFRLAGAVIEERFGQMRGRSLHDLHLGSISDDIKNQYDHAVSERAPVYCVHEFVTEDFKTRRYDRVVMPLASKSQIVDGLFGALVFH